ncbi:MAG: hypothetical protein CSA49_04545 [Gammaproteobacteria bacterium]|nr:MAG: hypothetical protein CSA49_04545 [Gammaproteobacteria bacterium]
MLVKTMSVKTIPVKTRVGNSLLVMLFIASAGMADTVLSQEFLHYLADFETDSGEWVDPQELEAMISLDEVESDQQQENEDE